jgi:hypothetical protein
MTKANTNETVNAATEMATSGSNHWMADGKLYIRVVASKKPEYNGQVLRFSSFRQDGIIMGSVVDEKTLKTIESGKYRGCDSFSKETQKLFIAMAKQKGLESLVTKFTKISEGTSRQATSYDFSALLAPAQ